MKRFMKDSIPEELFRILACPVCKADLEYGKDKKTLVCTKCKHEYEIRDGIPILLPPKK